MPIAALIALVSGVVAGLPQDIAAFNSLKAMLAGGKETITADELEKLRSTAAAEHKKTQES